MDVCPRGFEPHFWQVFSSHLAALFFYISCECLYVSLSLCPSLFVSLCLSLSLTLRVMGSAGTGGSGARRSSKRRFDGGAAENVFHGAGRRRRHRARPTSSQLLQLLLLLLLLLLQLKGVFRSGRHDAVGAAAAGGGGGCQGDHRIGRNVARAEERRRPRRRLMRSSVHLVAGRSRC